MNEVLYDMLAILLADYYDPDNIFKAYENNYVLPKNGKFVIITELQTTSAAYPESTFTGVLPTGSSHIGNLDVTNFQLDFYGAPARQMCASTRLYLQSGDGSNWLASQTPSLTVYNVHEMMNLTEVLDQNKYLPRFAVKFSLFNNNNISYDAYGFASVDPNLIHVF